MILDIVDIMGRIVIRAIILTIVLFVLAMLGPFKSHGATRCRFAYVAHKVTDLKALTLGLQTQLEEDEERIERQGALISALRERGMALEATGASLTAASQRFNALLGCLGEIPLTRYGQPEGPSGYIFKVSNSVEEFSFPTTALDISYDNSPVGAWTYVDTCNRSRVTARSSLLKEGE